MQHTTDASAIRALWDSVVDAWNTGDGARFAGCFAAEADFIGFDGTHLTDQPTIASVHQELFDTWLKGSRLAGEPTIRMLGDGRRPARRARRHDPAQEAEAVTGASIDSDAHRDVPRRALGVHVVPEHAGAQDRHHAPRHAVVVRHRCGVEAVRPPHCHAMTGCSAHAR
jgi:uncharacterized protein (TIGR02246 family)